MSPQEEANFPSSTEEQAKLSAEPEKGLPGLHRAPSPHPAGTTGLSLLIRPEGTRGLWASSLFSTSTEHHVGIAQTPRLPTPSHLVSSWSLPFPS